jgi:hypothetical protein
MCRNALNSNPSASAARSIIRAKPTAVKGEPRSLTKTNGADRLSRWSRYTPASRATEALEQQPSVYCCCAGRMVLDLARALSASSAESTGRQVTRVNAVEFPIAAEVAADISSGQSATA